MAKKANNSIEMQRHQDCPAGFAPLEALRVVSLKAIAQLLDTTRSSARRWLREAGIRPISLGRGTKGAIRYRWTDVEAWLQSRQHVE